MGYGAGTSYPVEADLKSFLYAAGFLDSATAPTGRWASLDFTVAIGEGVADFERAASRKFLATSYTKQFDGPAMRNGRLFTGDVLSVSEISFLGAAMTGQTVQLDGIYTMTNAEYALGPVNAPALSRPYQWIDFFRRWEAPTPWAQRYQLKIAGSFGYGTVLPHAVWNGMLVGAALLLFTQIGLFRSKGMRKWAEADVLEDYGETNKLLEFADRWRLDWERAVMLYRDYTAGLGGTF